jgi:hypothetical protein
MSELLLVIRELLLELRLLFADYLNLFALKLAGWGLNPRGEQWLIDLAR